MPVSTREVKKEERTPQPEPETKLQQPAPKKETLPPMPDMFANNPFEFKDLKPSNLGLPGKLPAASKTNEVKAAPPSTLPDLKFAEMPFKGSMLS